MEENISAIPCFVADNSFLASYLLQDEEYSEQAESDIKNLMLSNGQIYVPQIFWFEIGNVLLCNSRPNKKTGIPRITKTELMDNKYDLGLLPIYTDLQPDEEIQTRIFTYAEEYGLTYYDAAYLELASRHNLPLKTYDEDLKAAYEKMKNL